MIYVGIDNGVTGSIGFRGGSNGSVFSIPTMKELSYTKKKQYITRVDTHRLEQILKGIVCIAYIERPMINPMRWKASMSAMRCLEAVLIVIEKLKIPYKYIDSKEWQKELLPSGIKGSPELKMAGVMVARRLFPKVAIPKNCDADGLLIAEYCRIKNQEKKQEGNDD